uniref:Ribonuclease H-like domain-containing protein n=1 Tax=Tanacetum cinerariifolium TaxID=118510 RepID=A0A6L2N131_TANCI|nr:ribonuclease H-like domain-containing protein [Tanacetum cinerariifolium]
MMATSKQLNCHQGFNPKSRTFDIDNEDHGSIHNSTCTGDLYHVIAPSHIPHAFFVSQHTWHQRLRHPGGEVLCRLVSSNFIPYNKEKPPVLCHVCQLGKHVRLPFVSSSTMISSILTLFTRITWTLVLRPPDVNVVRCMYLFRHKYLPDGTLSRYKARLVANGSTQLEGVDFISFDVKNAFLHKDLSETVYMHQPPGFWDSTHPDYVCLLQRSLYGLKQASRAWFQRFASYITRYVVEILERAAMVNCNPSRTPVDTESTLGTTGDVVSDPTLYRSLAGSLQYLTFTRPDISYDVQQAGCPTTRRSTSGYCVFLGNNLLSWFAKHQPTLSRSSAEAEYRGVANAVTETCWLRNLLRELHTLLSFATLFYCDNVIAVYLSSNLIQHQRTKHIEIDSHFVRDLVTSSQVRVLHVPSRYQFADIFTEGVPTALFEEFRFSLSVLCPPAQTAREC